MPKIYLVHAMALSMGPVETSFRKIWPQARLAHLLESSLPVDLEQEGRLTEAMIWRFRELGRYCAGAGADAILFSCSAFGPAIEAVKHDHRIPVLKPNEALYDELAAGGAGSRCSPPSSPRCLRCWPRSKSTRCNGARKRTFAPASWKVRSMP